MDRRSFLSGALAWLASLFAWRPRTLTELPGGFRRLSEPYIIDPGVSIGLLELAEDRSGT